MSEDIKVETLVSLLKCMKFETSEFGIKLKNGIFKTANKDLFRKIVCFALNGINEFEDFVENYKRPSLPVKVEAQFRNSLKGIVSTLNSLCSDKYNLKAITQSYVIAPQGPKVVAFLTSLCIMILFIKFKCMGDLYEPPQNDVECEQFLLKHTSDQDSDLDTLIEQAELELLLARSDYEAPETNFFNYLQNSSLPETLRTSRKHEDFEVAVKNREGSLMCRLEEIQSNINENRLLLSQLDSLDSNIEKLLNSKAGSVDGLTILSDLGFKDNISARIHGMELIENGKLKLHCLFNVAHTIYEKIVNDTDIITQLDNCVKWLKEERSSIPKFSLTDEEEQELLKICEKYTPLVERRTEEAYQFFLQSENPTHRAIRDYLEFENSSLARDAFAEEKPLNVSCALPVAENELFEWVLGKNVDNSKRYFGGSVKKNSIKSNPSLSLSSRKILADKTNSVVQKRIVNNQKWKHALLEGLCSDRRATLASPLARRERFKNKYFDDKRKPLKPTTSKALFCSSSPLNQSPVCKPSFNKVSNVDSVTGLPECSSVISEVSSMKCSPAKQDANDSISSLALGCGFNLNKSLSEPCLDLSQELLKWDCSFSDTELDRLDSPAMHNDSVEKSNVTF